MGLRTAGPGFLHQSQHTTPHLVLICSADASMGLSQPLASLFLSLMDETCPEGRTHESSPFSFPRNRGGGADVRVKAAVLLLRRDKRE